MKLAILIQNSVDVRLHCHGYSYFSHFSVSSNVAHLIIFIIYYSGLSTETVRILLL